MLVQMLFCLILHIWFIHLSCDSYGSNNNINRIHELCEEIYRMKQGSKSLKDYYGFVKG